jgi:glycosyltransferase involved in cell wall biosynthesis
MGKKAKTVGVSDLAWRCRVRKGNFREAKVTTHPNGSMDLDLPELSEGELQEMLPKVSVVTITKDRGMFAGIMLYNWMNIKYPRDKLEWVIVDDSEDTSQYDLRDYIPQDDPYIKYHRLDKWYPVAEKRNKAVELCNYEYIVHMDDDDYYFPDHVLAKMRIMLHYKCNGVLSMPIGIYDMMEKSSYIMELVGRDRYNTNDIAEATVAYKKDYWRRNPWISEHEKGMGEGRGFIGSHFNQWVNVHFMFNMVSITHSKNITGHNRRFINENLESFKTGNFEDVFTSGFNQNLDNVRKMLAADYIQPDIPEDSIKVMNL